jgi:hypothetical protein
VKSFIRVSLRSSIIMPTKKFSNISLNAKPIATEANA